MHGMIVQPQGRLQQPKGSMECDWGQCPTASRTLLLTHHDHQQRGRTDLGVELMHKCQAASVLLSKSSAASCIFAVCHQALTRSVST